MAPVGVGDNVIFQGGLEIRGYVKRHANKHLLSLLNKLNNAFSGKYRFV